MTSKPDSTDCVAAAFDSASWGPGVSKCADTNAIFSVADTGGGQGYIEYCAYYTELTNDYRANSLSAANRSCLDDQRLDTSLATATNIVATIVPCLTAYCEGSPACKQQNPFPCLQSSLADNGAVLKTDAVTSCMDQICAGHPTLQANQDIAGIGMVASYIIQTSIAFSIALALLLLAIWPRARSNRTGSEIQVRSRNDLSKTHADTDRKSPESHKLYESLYQALTAFILSQNFLALAISIAALQALNAPGDLGALDEVALGSASGLVLFPTTIGLYTLASFYRGGQSWYLFTLSAIVWVLGFSIVLGPQMVRLNSQNRAAKPLYAITAGSPRVCGNAPPFQVCGDLEPQSLHPEYSFYYTLCLPVMLGLTIWQLCSLESFSGFLNKILPRSFRQKWQTPLLLVVHLGAVGFLTAPCYFFFQSISDLLSNDAVNTTWAFGQIVAVLATVPTVIEFLHTYFEKTRSSHVRKANPRFLVHDTYGLVHEDMELHDGNYSNQLPAQLIDASGETKSD